jgi:tRNA threonylcarbamoyladenosine biosynthesis protein TsaE
MVPASAVTVLQATDIQARRAGDNNDPHVRYSPLLTSEKRAELCPKVRSGFHFVILFFVCAIIQAMKNRISHSLEETQQIAEEWLVDISNTYQDSDEALVVGLSGHLGAGKTAFVKCIAKALGVNEAVTSPTFVIMKIYDIDPNDILLKEASFPWKHLVHIDAYRLEQPEELEALRFEDIVADKNDLVLIEWPENVGLKDFKPNAHISFQIEGDSHGIQFK